MNIETLANMRAMESAYQSRNPLLLDMLAEGTLKAEGEMKLKRIQFDSFTEVSDELDRVCELISVSRREFLETALIDALHRAREAFHSTYKNVTGHDYDTLGAESC